MEEKIIFSSSINQLEHHEHDTTNFTLLKNRISERAFAKRNEVIEEAKNNKFK